MSLIRLFLIAAISVQLASCDQALVADHALEVHVVDEEGRALPDMSVLTFRTDLTSPLPTGEIRRNPEVKTDANGMATIRFKSVRHESGGPSPTAAVSKDGWYATSAAAEKWLPITPGSRSSYQARVQCVMKPIKNPIAMYAKNTVGEMERYIRIPELNKEYGYDLMLAQALPPLGNGKTADFHFRVEGSYTDRNESDLKMILRFSSPDDGVVEFLTPQRNDMSDPRMRGSQYLSAYLAPETGYVNEVTRFHQTSGGGGVRKTDSDVKRNFYFRTRTKTLPDGQIISAHYGKIYGDFEFTSGNLEKGFYANFCIAVSYFNPVENDRNVEFDVKKNLLPDGNVGKP